MTQSGATAGILVIDDREEFRYLVERAFRKNGLTSDFVGFSNGSEALRYLFGEDKYADRSEWPLPALVLVDLRMPEFDGFQFIRRVKSDHRLASLVVIALSESHDISDIKRAYEMGANSYVTKPSNWEDLQNTVTNIYDTWVLRNRAAE